MKKSDYKTSRSNLVNVPLPKETRTYKPVSHEQLMDLTLESVLQAGYNVQKESYTMAKDGQIANGRYTISDISDKDMQIQIGWQNSYNKQVSLKFAIGAQIFICENGCVSGDMGNFKKKHVGDVQEFTPRSIIEYIKTSAEVFTAMQKQRDELKNVEVDRRVAAELIGRMYIEEEFINSTQLNIIKGQLNSPTYDYGAPNSMWELYQFVTYSLKEDHPASWMEDHISAHDFFTTNAGLIVPSSTVAHEHTIPESPYKQLDWTETVEEEEDFMQNDIIND